MYTKEVGLFLEPLADVAQSREHGRTARAGERASSDTRVRGGEDEGGSEGRILLR